MWQAIKNFFKPPVKSVSKSEVKVTSPSLVSRIISTVVCDHTFVFKNQGWVLTSPVKPKTKKVYALMNNVVCSKCSTSKYVAIS